MKTKAKYIVWVVQEKGDRPEPNGDGSVSFAAAQRISREIRSLCHRVHVAPVGWQPKGSRLQ